MVEEGAIEVTSKRAVDTRIHQELRSGPEYPSGGNWFVPATDVYETPEEIILVMDMPGVCYDCVQANIVEDELIVTGHVTHGEDEEDYVLYREYDVGHYHRHFGLPPVIDRVKIDATMADGVLTVTMPKIEEVKPRRIPVKGVG